MKRKLPLQQIPEDLKQMDMREPGIRWMKESMQGRSFSSWNMMSMVQMWQGLSYRNMVSLLQKISGMGMMQEHWKLFQNICRRKGFL